MYSSESECFSSFNFRSCFEKFDPSRKDERSTSESKVVVVVIAVIEESCIPRFRRMVSLVEKFKNESVVLLSIHPDISFDNNRGIIEGAGKEEIYIIAV